MDMGIFIYLYVNRRVWVL